MLWEEEPKQLWSLRRSYITGQAKSKHLPHLSWHRKRIQSLATTPHPPPPTTTTYSCARVQVWGRGWDGMEGMEEGRWAGKDIRLRLFLLIGGFGLLPLNHAAPHDAVKTPQVEEGDGAKQTHGDNLHSKTSSEVEICHFDATSVNVMTSSCPALPAGDLLL